MDLSNKHIHYDVFHSYSGSLKPELVRRFTISEKKRTKKKKQLVLNVLKLNRSWHNLALINNH